MTIAPLLGPGLIFYLFGWTDLAGKAQELSITKVRFDRGPYRFHGRVRALADAAREKGLEF